MTRRLRFVVLAVLAGAALASVTAVSAATVRPLLASSPFAPLSGPSVPCLNGGLPCYLPSEIQQAYNFPSGPAAPNGAGQTIVVVTAYGAPFVGPDIQTFGALTGVPYAPNLTVVPQKTAIPAAPAARVVAASTITAAMLPASNKIFISFPPCSVTPQAPYIAVAAVRPPPKLGAHLLVSERPRKRKGGCSEQAHNAADRARDCRDSADRRGGAGRNALVRHRASERSGNDRSTLVARAGVPQSRRLQLLLPVRNDPIDCGRAGWRVDRLEVPVLVLMKVEDDGTDLPGSGVDGQEFLQCRNSIARRKSFSRSAHSRM